MPTLVLMIVIRQFLVIINKYASEERFAIILKAIACLLTTKYQILYDENGEITNV